MIYIIYLHMGRKLYQGKYRVDTIRLKDWDYRSNGQYFITVRTKEKGDILGKIIDNRLIPNIIGIMADKYLKEIPCHFSFVKIHACVVMPDHVHMLLEINKRKYVDVEPRYSVALHHISPLNATRHGVLRQEKEDPVGTGHGLSLQINRPKKGSISIIVNQFKGAVKRYCNKNNYQFEWQSKFYDRIIRDELEFVNTKTYIRNNPKNYSIKNNPHPNE